MKKILLLLLLIFITKVSMNAQTYSVSNSASGFIYIGTKGSLSDFVDEDGNTLPSWTGNYNIRIQSGKNVYIGNSSSNHAQPVIDTLFVDGTINNTAYRTTVNIGTIIVSGTGNFNADNHSGGRLYVNVEDIVLEDGAEFAVPSVGSNSYSGLNWSGSISVADNVTLTTSGASNNLISQSQINALPGSNPKAVASGTLSGVASDVNSIILSGNTAITADLSSSSADIYTQGNDLVISNAISSNVTIYADASSEASPTVNLFFNDNASGTITLAPNNNRVRSITMNTNSTEGITLGHPIDIINTSYNNNALTLTNGRLITTETNVLFLNQYSFVSNAVYSWSGHASGGSNSSYIDGPIMKTINFSAALKSALSITGNNFYMMMPVGKNGILREAGIGMPTADTQTTFRFEYINNTHPQYRDIHASSTVSQVSEFEYWNIDRIFGSASAAVVLTYDANSGINNTHVSNAQVMHFNGTHWEDQGNQTQHTVGENIGALLSTSASSFSPFTLGGGGGHDLPVELTYFEAEKNNDNTISLYWETASEIDNSHFEIEASNDGRNFEMIGEVNGNGNSNTVIEYVYHVTATVATQYKWFRLKQVDFDGAYEYSETIQVEVSNIEFTDLNIFPIPAQNTIHTTIDNASEITSVNIHNAYGMHVKEVSPQNINTIDISNLLDGVYFLTVTTASGQKEVKRFIVKN